MKTLILATVSTAALLLAGAASAQTATGVEAMFANSAAGLQSLNGTDSSRPTGAAYDSRSYVAQIGDGNTANIDQQTAGSGGGPSASDANFGHPLNSTVLQGWGGGRSDNSTVGVSQSGTDNLSVVMQRNYPSSNSGTNSAGVSQTGKNENAFTYQYGNNNTSSLSQSGTDSAAPSSSVHDESDANNGGTFAGSFHGVDQTQSHLNDAGGRVIQDEAVHNTASLSQSGNDDKGTIVQWYAEDNSASVIQTNTNNAAAAYQTGHDSTIGINQTGTNNAASVFQVSGDQDGSAYGVVGANDSYQNLAQVTQTGNGATATLLQGGDNNQGSISQNNSDGAPYKGVLASSAGLRQVGSQNVAGITQSGGDDHALTEQSGTSNHSSVNQRTEGAYSLVNQNGTTNVANVSQTFGGASNSFFMVSKVDQEGMNNNAGVNQSGRDAFSDVVQMGLGGTNNVGITQSAFNAISYANQTGGGNTINVNQH